ncbi:MAG: phospho-N-acetylmuramoyl-pentapeptide-transferase [Bacteroidetes bacterium HGW-Bacteroidetes-21]|jgi:phospho-N-acetylmuramoyl-pentapeptide-transferase|nr:MAG: phospho-N-acetylmuramoyl-pentapeptide-transferase [Bacteroidetes bacterium HGW-Bacteroidetes-21]
MLYYLFTYLNKFDVPGAGMFNYISFRAALAIITSLIISLFIGKRIINFLHKKQVGETIRDLGLEGQMQKKGTPTMGGLIILASLIIPVLLFARIDNIYIILLLITTVWLGLMGFIDDYIKVFKHDKKGLKGKFKILGQVSLGVIVGISIYTSNDIVIRDKIGGQKDSNITVDQKAADQTFESHSIFLSEDTKSTKTTLPFVKNNEFDYEYLIWFLPEAMRKQWVWLVYILAVVFIITAVSNGANLTDGMDGLATGVSSIIVSTLAVFAYVSGNIIFADYLNIMYIPYSGETVVFASAFIGATVGFLWYNSYPAQVFMGDTGSLAIGGIIAVFAILIRKEILLPILCGIFFVESLSVMLQVAYFKRTKKKYGEGRRIFLMSPLHHHYQKKGYPETKIVTRFWIVAIMLAVLTIVTLKVR